MHTLEGIGGQYHGLVAAIPPGGLTVGKLLDSDLTLEDPLVSRSHARFQRLQSEVCVEDLGSTNGTFVNDVQVRQCVLRNGDRVQIGGSLFRYRDTDGGVAAGPEPSDGPPAHRRSAPVRGYRRGRARLRLERHAPETRADRSAEKTLAALASLGKAGPGRASLEGTLDRILELVFELLDVDRGCIILLDEGGEPEPGAVRYREPEQATSDMPISRTLLRQAIEQESALLIADTMADESLARGRKRPGPSAAVRRVRAHPLRRAGPGVFCVDTQRLEDWTRKISAPWSPSRSRPAMLLHQARLEKIIRREERRRLQLERFVSAPVPSGILPIGKRPLPAAWEVAERITILFADIRGFTPLSEKLPPAEVVALLNRLSTRLCQPVLQYGGTGTSTSATA